MSIRSELASNLRVTEPSLVAMIVDNKNGKVVYADKAVGEAMVMHMGNQDGGLDKITTKPWPANPPRGVKLTREIGKRTVISASTFGHEDGVVFYVKNW